MIFMVADLHRMMLVLSVRQDDQHSVKIGQTVKFVPDGDKDNPVFAKIDRLSHNVDPKTRAIKAMALVNSTDHRLRDQAFGKATITLRSQGEKVVAVPEDAIQWEGCSHVVFLLERTVDKNDDDDRLGHGKKDDDDKHDKSKVVFETRRVKLGIRSGGYVEVTEGLEESDRIAVLGSHVLKSHLFKDRIGAADE
jgi:Cu(I)/Ag(I) efflux system membrane fusion protein